MVILKTKFSISVSLLGSTVDHIFSIWQILEKKSEYNQVCQLFIDFEEVYHTIKRESLFDILITFGVPGKLD
jgi:hypothetical protein